MKRYEKMTAKEIMDAYNKPYELKDGAGCTGCMKFDTYTSRGKRCNCSSGTCYENIRDFLNEDIEVLSLWQTFESDNDLTNCFRQWIDAGQKDISAWAFINYICTKIEVDK